MSRSSTRTCRSSSRRWGSTSPRSCASRSCTTSSTARASYNTFVRLDMEGERLHRAHAASCSRTASIRRTRRTSASCCRATCIARGPTSSTPCSSVAACASARGRTRSRRPSRFPKRKRSTRTMSSACACCWTRGNYPGIATHDPAIIDEAKRYRRRAADRPLAIRVSDAIRHPPRPAGAARARRISNARLRAVRHAVVSVSHAPPGGASGERRVHHGQRRSARCSAEADGSDDVARAVSARPITRRATNPPSADTPPCTTVPPRSRGATDSPTASRSWPSLRRLATVGAPSFSS